MKTTGKNTKVENLPKGLKRKNYYPLNELAEHFGVSVWTIRLWANRFNMIKPHLDKKGNLMFSAENAERIGIIFHLSKKKGMTLNRVRKYLEEGGNKTAA